MPPSVRIEARAWDDPRFAVMGHTLGVDRDTALIKFARVWAYQTEENAPTLPARLFDAITGLEGSAVAAVEAGLADVDTDGALRPRGTDGLSWLATYREQTSAGRAAGGKARAAGARRGSHGEFLPGLEPADDQQRPVSGQRAQQDSQHHQESPRSPQSQSQSQSLTTHKDPATEDSPSARRLSAATAAAEKLAELLRQHLLTLKPDHAVGLTPQWASRRKSWTREFGTLLKTDRRKPEDAAALIRWVFGDQGGSEYRFVVESPAALRLKWDRIESAMRARRGPSRSNGSYNPIATGADADPVLRPLRRRT